MHIVPWARKDSGVLQGSALLQGCVVMQELNIHIDLALPTPSPSHTLTSIQELQPSLTCAAAQTTGKGQILKVPARPTKFPDSSSPWGSALCYQSLYVGDKEEGAALWADCCPSQALLPPHSKAIEELEAARSALPFAVIINQAGVTFPAAASFGQHWHSSKPWVRSAEWVPEWLHPSTWLAGRCHPCTWIPLEDAIPACRAACTSTYNRYEFLLQRKYILIMQTLCAFLKHGGKKNQDPVLIFLWNHYSFEIHG